MMSKWTSCISGILRPRPFITFEQSANASLMNRNTKQLIETSAGATQAHAPTAAHINISQHVPMSL
jgi:hypothetical protein